jgi:hypothetical protein
MSECWWETEGSKLEQEQLADSLDALRTDEVVLIGGSEHYEAEDGRFFLDRFLLFISVLEVPSPPEARGDLHRRVRRRPAA